MFFFSVVKMKTFRRFFFIFMLETYIAGTRLNRLTDAVLTTMYVLDKNKKIRYTKVQVGKDQEKAQSEKDSHSKNRGGKKQTNNQVLIP